MTISDLVEEKVQEYSAEKDRTRPRLGRIYALFNSVLSDVAIDARTVFRGLFPSVGIREYMDRHALALRLPRVVNESDAHLRQRLMFASFYMQYLGSRESLHGFMNSHFLGRWTIIEMPRDAFTIGTLSGHQVATPIGGDAPIMAGEGLYVYVQNLTEAESALIEEYLQNNIPPDVGHWIERR